MHSRRALQEIVDVHSAYAASGGSLYPKLLDAMRHGAQALKAPEILVPDAKFIRLVHNMDSKPMQRWTTHEIKELHANAMLAASAAALTRESYLTVSSESGFRPAPAQELIDLVQDMSVKDLHEWPAKDIRSLHGFAMLVIQAYALNISLEVQPEAEPGVDLDKLITAAAIHGRDSDPDHEVGDLQQYLRATWGVLTEAQKSAVFLLPTVSATYESAMGEELDISQPPQRSARMRP